MSPLPYPALNRSTFAPPSLSYSPRFAERQYYPARQRFTLPLPAADKAAAAAGGRRPRAVVLEAGKRLSDYGLKGGDVLLFKDLGPQIGYRWGGSAVTEGIATPSPLPGPALK